VWFQNRRSRWRKNEIKNKPAPHDNTYNNKASFITPPPAVAPTYSHYPTPYSTAFIFPPFFQYNIDNSSLPQTVDTRSLLQDVDEHSTDEYAAAVGLLSVLNRQN